MKTTVAIIFSFLIPSVSFAAQLTNDQATSLISVVQSSTTTPAVAFVPLITAFSSITVPQAESLINVVQQAPGVPADAFVGMLLAFTVDPVLAGVPPVIETPVIIEPMPKPIIPEPKVTRVPYQAVEPTKTDVVATNTEIVSERNENYKFKNNTDALGITYTTAVVKVWREYTGEPAKDVSVEVYSESGLVSKAGYWSTEGRLVAGEAPFISDSTIGDTEATALTVEIPINLYLPSREHDIRIEVHPDNTSSSKQSSYRGVLVELR